MSEMAGQETPPDGGQEDDPDGTVPPVTVSGGLRLPQIGVRFE